MTAPLTSPTEALHPACGGCILKLLAVPTCRIDPGALSPDRSLACTDFHENRGLLLRARVLDFNVSHLNPTGTTNPIRQPRSWKEVTHDADRA